jgi:hypothetical protein
MVEMLSNYNGQDVVFDRSWYGEKVWPHVYGRAPQLSVEDLQVLQEFEDVNDAKRILMTDDDKQAHWQRCVDNKEPLTLDQFKAASKLFMNLVMPETLTSYQFTMATKKDVDDGSIWGMLGLEGPKGDGIAAASQATGAVSSIPIQTITNAKISAANVSTVPVGVVMTPEQKKLMEANAINDILSSRIVKKKGEHYDAIEKKVREFLNRELAVLLGMEGKKDTCLTSDEILFVRLLMKKSGGKNG